MIIVVNFFIHPQNIWRIKVFQGLCNNTRNNLLVFYLVTIQRIVFVVYLVLTL